MIANYVTFMHNIRRYTALFHRDFFRLMESPLSIETGKIPSITISGFLQDIRDLEVGVADLGIHFCIRVDNQKPKYIKYENIQKALDQSKNRQRKNILTSNPIFPTVSPLEVSRMEDAEPDFTELKNLLLDAIKKPIEEGIEIRITSTEGWFLELPWETFFSGKIFVVREVGSVTGLNATDNSKNHLAVLIATATSHQGQQLGHIKSKADEEIKTIFQSFGQLRADERSSYFRLDTILLVSHATPVYVKKFVDWSVYNHAHLIMHGLPDGNICLEQDDGVCVDTMSIKDFLDSFDGSCLKLLFLAFCYSGGGLTSAGSSLSFQAVKRGIAQCVIGYSHPVGEDSALEFTQQFYGRLSSITSPDTKREITKLYRESLKGYFDKKPNSKYVPLLYIGR